MQVGSLVTPSKRFLGDVVLKLMRIVGDLYFVPSTPKEGDIYIVEELYPEHEKNRPCVRVEGLRCISKEYGDIDLNEWCFDELQKPMDVSRLIENQLVNNKL